MKRVHQYVISTVIVFAIFVGFILIVPKGSFEWGIDVGDSFYYEMRTWGDHGNQYLAGIPRNTLLILNNTVFETAIITLPPVNWITGAESFLTSVVRAIKVNCSFVNGTAIPSRVNDIVSEIISGCLLPIGDWSVLDSFYEDEIAPWEPSQEYYAAKLLEDRFVFEWMSYGDFDSREDWIGEVALENGVPYKIVWHYNHSMADIYIELSLVDS